jgi:hypothetical protein
MSAAHTVRVTSGWLALALLAVLTGYGGTTGKIAGRITDRSTGEPLIGANIVIRETRLGASTDAAGTYFILNVHPGRYVVSISLVGFESVLKTDVVVSADRTTRIDMALNPAMIEGSMITVTAERPIVQKDVTASEQVVTGEVFDRSFVRTVTEAIETQVGIFSSPVAVAWERGQRTQFFRGSSNIEAVYMIDNLSVNSGLLSDNYSGLNTSAIEEISLLTGGYNAEYGDARSAIVNIIQKEATSGLNGSFLARMRPSGVYHFGRNMYDQENYDYEYFNLDYWTRQSQDVNNQEFYGKNPDSLLQAWRRQITPNDTLAKYADRPEYEFEGTLYGGLTEDLNFLASGRWKQGVGIFPQAIPYNNEYNLQGYLNYRMSPSLKFRLGGFYGQYYSADYLNVNLNTTESAQEAGWLAPMRIDEQYARAKYNPMGAIYRQWPEFRIWTQLYGRLTHVLSAGSYYEVTLSYLRDNSDRSDRDRRVPDSLWSRRDDTQKMVNRFLDYGWYHTWNRSSSKVYQVKAEYVNQVSQEHLLKSGFTFKSFDLSYESFQGVYEGGNRWNLLNVFDGRPYEGTVYAQDKMEFPGLIVNLGVRFDFFNQNRTASASMYDPVAFQPTTPGHDPTKPLGYPGTPDRVQTKLQTAFAPRIGLSHPISENSVLHFVYGHFYQRPSWARMFGFPFVNYTENMNTVLDPFADQITYMEEWQGWYGNPDMGYERTIQYELGIDNNIADILRLDFTGYYKDATRVADVITGVYAAQYTATKALMISNSGYADVRGVEAKVNSRAPGPLSGGASYEVYWSFEGEVGYRQLYEPGSTRVNVPKGLRNERGAWSDYHRVKAWLNLYFPEGEGPDVFGTKLLSDFNAYVYFWWRIGEPYTYHGPGDVSTEPNNMRWFDYYQMNLKLAKAFRVFNVRAEISLDIRNLFDWKFLRLLDGDDLIRWHENPDLPDEERLPKNWFSNEPDEWEWYSYEVPPRQAFLQFKVDF